MKRSDNIGWAQVKAGVLITLALLLFAGGVVIMGDKTKFFIPKGSLSVIMTDVAGLKIGAPVWLAGVDVGLVRKIRFLKPDKSNELYINICVNGIELSAGANAAGSSQPVGVVTVLVAVPGSSMGTNGGTNISAQKPVIPSTSKNQPVNDITESHDFWLKFTLASHQ